MLDIQVNVVHHTTDGQMPFPCSIPIPMGQEFTNANAGPPALFVASLWLFLFIMPEAIVDVALLVSLWIRGSRNAPVVIVARCRHLGWQGILRGYMRVHCWPEGIPMNASHP
jgi:hypothetical protein